MLGQSLVTETLSYWYVQQSHDTLLSNGELQRYASKDAQPPEVSDRALEAVVRNIDNSSGSQPGVLSTTSGISKTTGMYSFNQWHAIYAHPACEFRARVRFLKQLARQDDPAQFAALARGNRFDPIDVVVLESRGETLNYRATDVDFPNSDERVTIEFNRASFPPSIGKSVRLARTSSLRRADGETKNVGNQASKA